jgi:hypothetical protein
VTKRNSFVTLTLGPMLKNYGRNLRMFVIS